MLAVQVKSKETNHNPNIPYNEHHIADASYESSPSHIDFLEIYKPTACASQNDNYYDLKKNGDPDSCHGSIRTHLASIYQSQNSNNKYVDHITQTLSDNSL